MAKQLVLQPYPRKANTLLSDPNLFPMPNQKLGENLLNSSIKFAFNRCLKNKVGDEKEKIDTPEKWVELTIKHLKERSDPILSSYFVSQLNAEEIFEFDAVSYEMQRHRMSIGIFYQYLILELMRNRWSTFDGTREGDVVADIDTPMFESGIRIYMSVKKSADTVGGQDISGVIRRLEDVAKEEKNLNRPYITIICNATPPKGKLKGYDDRKIKTNRSGQPYSLNCEFWGPGFIFPYLTGRSALEIYLLAIKEVANYLPFMTIKFRKKCSSLLISELKEMGMLTDKEKIDPIKFLKFVVNE
jgi:hypothetical protein